WWAGPSGGGGGGGAGAGGRGPGAARPAELETQGYYLHRAVLDACMQAVLGTMLGQTRAEDGRFIYLPVEVARVAVYGRPAGSLWSHARLVERTRQGIVTDVRVFSHAGPLRVERKG